MFFLVELLFERDAEVKRSTVPQKSISFGKFRITNYAIQDIYRLIIVLGILYLILGQAEMLPAWLAVGE